MINSLKANNGTFANLASVAVQPVSVTSTAYAVQQQTSTVSSMTSLAPVPPKDALINIPIIQHASVGLTVNRKTTLAGIADLLSTATVRIPINNHSSYLMPTYALTLDAGKVYDPRLAQGFVTTATKFQPYEQLTGIAYERPEVIMLTNFQPLFDADVSHTSPNFIGYDEIGIYPHMTDTGRFIDAQIAYRNLTSWNAYTFTRSLRGSFPSLNQTFHTRSSETTDALARLKTNASFLLNLVNVIETQKYQLDLRHDTYAVEPIDVVSTMGRNFTQARVAAGPVDVETILRRSATTYLPQKYDCVDALLSMGYTLDSVKNVFSSTKIWMQILAELKSMLKHHSLAFLDIDPSYQRHDTNPTTILIPPVKYFGLSSNLPSLPTLDEIIDLDVGNASKTISLLEPAFTSIYENAFFKNEEARIAALAHILTQEYRYSYGLSQEPVQRALQNFYGFTVQPNGNTTMLDSVFGSFGNNISDFPATIDQSLVSLAQNTVGRGGANAVGVLTFETKYVEGDTGTLTPGGDFFFDRILETDGSKFNTEALEALTTEVDDQHNQLNVIIDGLNLMSTPLHPDRLTIGTSKMSHVGNFLSTAIDTVNDVASKLINHSGTPLPVSLNDRLAAIYAHARNDNRLKSILFIYTMARISRSYSKNIGFFASRTQNDNTPLVDHLINQLVNELSSAVPETRSSVQFLSDQGLNKTTNTSSLTVDSIKSAMKTGTQLTLIIEQFMSEVVAEFRSKTTAITNNFTRYGGFLDTIVMMVAFDFVISMVARYSNQSIVGAHDGLNFFSKGIKTFVVSQTSMNHGLSFNELQQRLKGETSRVQQLLLMIINVLQKLSGGLKSTTNYLNGPRAKKQLQEVASVLDNDKDMIRMMFSQQQIMLLASTVDSLLSAVNSGYAQNTNQYGSYHDDGGKTTQEIVVLDESEITPAARNALYGLFGTGEFASQRGLNKRILTVGIPLGFTQRLKQKVKIREQKRASFQNKQNDIVQVTVYKVDVQNYDIVYKPQRFLFEMSRFPTRYTTAQWLPMSIQPTMSEIVNAIPTQCYTQNIDSGTATSITAGVEYASTAIAQVDGVRNTRAAFDDPTYDFLTAAQKSQILQNHITSQLLEIYIKLMTGINVAEYNYHMTDVPPPVESDFVKTIVDHGVQHVTDQAAAHAATLTQPTSRTSPGGVLFGHSIARGLTTVEGTLAGRAFSSPILSNAAGIAGKVSNAAQFREIASAGTATKSADQQKAQPAGSNLGAISSRHVNTTLHTFRISDYLANVISNVSSINAINRRVMTPKQFDRVFNIVLDPRNFEIDVAKTIETPYGKQALDLLLKHGDVVSSDSDNASITARFGGQVDVIAAERILGGRGFQQGRVKPNVNNFRFRDRDKTQGDLIADKYFVTIETFGEDEV